MLKDLLTFNKCLTVQWMNVNNAISESGVLCNWWMWVGGVELRVRAVRRKSAITITWAWRLGLLQGKTFM